MVNAFHGRQTIEQGIHGTLAFVYANSAERNAAGPFQDYDGYKLALDADTNEVYILTDPSVPTWELFATIGASGGDVTTVFGRNGDVIAAFGDYDSDQIENVSSVFGTSVSDALEYLRGLIVGGGGGGTVSGPDTTTDNAIVRWDGTDGYTVQNSGITIDDSGNIDTGGGTIDGYNLSTIFGLQADPSGFPDRTTSTIAVDDDTRTFSISPVSGSYSLLLSGALVTKTGTDSIVFPDVEGIHYFWFDENAVLNTSTLESEFFTVITGNSASVAVIYWNSDDGYTILFGEERHGLMDNKAHAHFHLAFGAQWYSGGALEDITADGSGNLAIHAQFGVSSVKYADEDIFYNVSDGDPQDLGLPAKIPIYYRDGADGYWRKKEADEYPLIYSGTAGYAGTRLPWNEDTGAGWQLTELDNGHCVLMHYFATNDINNPIVGVQGQTDYINLSVAQTDASTALSRVSGLVLILSPEWVPLGTVIFQSENSYANIPKARIISTKEGLEYIDNRGKSIKIATESISHGSLAGLGDDDHPQYLLADGTRSMINNLNMGANELTNVTLVDGVDVSDHRARHESGGADEISVAGLSGLLADPQTPLGHATTHEAGESDALDGYDIALNYIPESYTVTNDIIGEHIAGLDKLVGQLNQTPERCLRVALSGAQYSSIKEAVDYAIAQGASNSDPWLIRVCPGTYSEDPITVQSGIIISSTENRNDTVFVVAANPVQDLITMNGGYINGLVLSGVTDAAKALVRCATASTINVFHGLRFFNCSTGVDVENGAIAVFTNFSIIISGAGQGITTGINVDSSSSITVFGAFIRIATSALPAYGAGDPISTAFDIDGYANIVNVMANMPANSGSSDVFYLDNGAQVTLIGTRVQNADRGLHIGSSGSGTTIIVSSGYWTNNTDNLFNESSSSEIYVNASSDKVGINDVAGAAVFSGIVQSTGDKETFLAGQLDYRYTNGKQADVARFFHDSLSTGISKSGEVTDGGGLSVDVASGRGWISRHPEQDIFDVSWDTTNVSLTANQTNYVVYSDGYGLQSQTSDPSNEDVLLATVITSGTGVRFIHTTPTLVHDLPYELHEYLLDTRKIALSEGLNTVVGSDETKFTVNAGSYYRALSKFTFSEKTDTSFSYFYGTNGATEVAGQTSVDIANYDDGGSLTAMNDGYFRSDTVFLTSDGRVSVIYGTSEFENQDDADVADAASPPSFIEVSACRIARLIIEDGYGIVNVVDARPIASAANITTGGGASGGVTAHAELTGLNNDDHTQYLLTNGSRAMSGNLDMGSGNITNVGSVDGVDISAHASRHNPGGADALATAAAGDLLVGDSAAEGSVASFARSDHVHGVSAGTPVNVTKDTNAEGSASTFSRSDHKHDVSTAAASTLSGSNSEGSATTLARSDHNHALGGTVGGDLSGTLPNPTVTDLTITSEAHGDILYRNATNWVRLPAGTAGQVLQTNGAGADPSWVDASGGSSSTKLYLHLGMPNQANSTLGYFSVANNNAANAVLNTTFAGSPGINNGGVFPIAMPDCTLNRAAITFAQAAVSTGTQDPTKTLRIAMYKANYSTRTLLTNLDFQVTTTVGIFNNLGVSSFTEGLELTGIGQAVSFGELIGFEFVNQSGTGNINGLGRAFLMLEFDVT